LGFCVVSLSSAVIEYRKSKLTPDSETNIANHPDGDSKKLLFAGQLTASGGLFQ